MITIISGTNRKGSESLKIATAYKELLDQENIPNQLLDLSQLPPNFAYEGLYGNQLEGFNTILDKYIFPVERMVIVSPEYNGSFPGVVKSLIDGWDPKKLNLKKCALVGVASGRQGNARGMDHLTGILNYIGSYVVPLKIPISQVFNVLDDQGKIKDEEVISMLKKQIRLLVE